MTIPTRATFGPFTVDVPWTLPYLTKRDCREHVVKWEVLGAAALRKQPAAWSNTCEVSPMPSVRLSPGQLPLPIDEKACSRCGKILPLSMYSPVRERPGAYRAQCKSCRVKQQQACYVPSQNPTRWKPAEDAFISANWQGMTHAEIAQGLGRTRNAVRARASMLGCVDTSHRWTQQEIDCVRELYSGDADAPIDLRGLAKRLGRPASNICRKAKELGLAPNQHRRKVWERKVRLPMFATAEERRAYQSERQRAHLREHGHPRGALGLVHSGETRARVSEASRRMWDRHKREGAGLMSPESMQRRSDEMYQRHRNNPEMRRGFSRGKMGRREDLGGLYVRSSWEANAARILTYLERRGDISEWAYEATTFVFEDIKRGVRSYTPDFLVRYPDQSEPEYWEVKGWNHPRGKTALARMEKYYPAVKIRLIDEPEYKRLAAFFRGVIDGWE